MSKTIKMLVWALSSWAILMVVGIAWILFVASGLPFVPFGIVLGIGILSIISKPYPRMVR